MLHFETFRVITTNDYDTEAQSEKEHFPCDIDLKTDTGDWL